MKETPPTILKIPLQGGFTFDMVYVAGGEFMMGDDDGEYDDEKPAHQVKLDSFCIGKYPVTQALWQAVMGENPSQFKGENRPVEMVSWLVAQNFIEKLKKETGIEFRLPTEAEWEFVARGGNKSEGFLYAGSNKLIEVGWYRDNSYGETKPVGLKFPNELGLYDMSGNVLEWCEDDSHGGSYNDAPKDGSAWIDSPKRGYGRILRGGCYFFGALACRSSHRLIQPQGSRNSGFGFRLAAPSQQPTRKQDGFH